MSSNIQVEDQIEDQNRDFLNLLSLLSQEEINKIKKGHRELLEYIHSLNPPIITNTFRNNDTDGSLY